MDSSALLKRHVEEIGSPWVRQICEATSGHVILTVPTSEVEVVTALTRRIREDTLSFDDYTRLRADIRAVFNRNYVSIAIDAVVISRAAMLLETDPLRAADAVQLAAALEADVALLADEQPPLTFLAADARLLIAAQAEGLNIR